MWKKQIGLAAFVGLLAVMQLSTIASAEEAGIWLVYDGNMMPDYNDEITVYVHSDPMLFATNIIVYFTGDVNITSAMSEADCNNYGWDNGWNSDPYIDPAGWLMISGVSWGGVVDGTIGYFTFRYYGGEVTFAINGESGAFDPNCQPILFSGQPLIFGQDPNESFITGGTTTDNNDINTPPPQDVNDPNSQSEPNELSDSGGTPVDSNDVNQGLPVIFDYNSLLINRDRTERRKVLLNCPKGTEEMSFARFNEQEFESFTVSEENDNQSLLDNAIEISSDITTNQIWTANNTYHITADISVQALLVIEPGTTIVFAYGAKMSINNGGTLISSGTPDNPIIYTCDLIYPDWGFYYQTLYFYYGIYYYICPVYIEETASPATTVTYSFIEGALVGIATINITLDHPIENNYLIGNYYGIGEYGTRHTDIKNNMCFFNYYGGIEIYMSDLNGTGDANSIINIINNTCDWQSYGIIVHGVDNEDDLGYAIISNNIVTTSSDAGIYLDGNMYYTLNNTGYGGNLHDACSDTSCDLEQDNPVFETQMPYIEGEDILSVCYLRQDCNFINAGYEYIEETSALLHFY